MNFQAVSCRYGFSGLQRLYWHYLPRYSIHCKIKNVKSVQYQTQAYIHVCSRQPYTEEKYLLYNVAVRKIVREQMISFSSAALNSSEASKPQKNHETLLQSEGAERASDIDTAGQQTNYLKVSAASGLKRVSGQDNEMNEDVTYEADWSERETVVLTCCNMWEDQPDGASFIISYIDTDPPCNKHKANYNKNIARRLDEITADSGKRVRLVQRGSFMYRPIALVIEGSDGANMIPLAQELVSRGFRVIMPKLIGTRRTRPLIDYEGARYQHTLGERTCFIIDFLSAIGLNRVDVVVADTHGCLPVVTISSSVEESIFSSVTLLSPSLPTSSPPWLKPLWLSERVINWTGSSFLSPLQWLWLHAWIRRRIPDQLIRDESPLSGSALTHRLRTLAEISLGINYQVVEGFIDLFGVHRVPLLCVKSVTDGSTEQGSSRQEPLSDVESSLLGLNYTTKVISDNNNNNSRTVVDEEKSKSASGRFSRLVLLNSSHYDSGVTRNIVDEIIDMYKHVKH